MIRALIDRSVDVCLASDLDFCRRHMVGSLLMADAAGGRGRGKRRGGGRGNNRGGGNRGGRGGGR